ncbi:MAG TPA: PH domain-containing protein [Candidatus Dormibacteraeota bacterium]|nr:PH domain-containing protein [Candidatus Dormibacteraeota bacterium]
MVSATLIEEQLKEIGFNHHGWGRTEVRELQNIIMPDEKIEECVNGIYEGGFALLLATDLRVLLVDKKPLNYLTVEDLRFDMINEIDYSHRLIGAHIRISAGETSLQFNSVNQARLRKLIGHVQHAMAAAKKKQTYHQEGQTQHLERINYQLRSYLLKQYEQQQKLQDQLHEVQTGRRAVTPLPPAEVINPDPELADYLFAQSLLAQHHARTQGAQAADELAPGIAAAPRTRDEMAELYAEGVQEIFGKQSQGPVGDDGDGSGDPGTLPDRPAEINPLSVAYAKLPMALRNRKFGRPLFHPHSQEAVSVPTVPAAEVQL